MKHSSFYVIFGIAIGIAFVFQVREVLRLLTPASNRFCDYANFYVWGKYLASGFDPYALDQREIETVKRESPIYACGTPNQSPVLYEFFSLFQGFGYRRSLVLWLSVCAVAAALCAELVLTAAGYRWKAGILVTAAIFLVQSSLIEGLSLGQTAIPVTLLLVGALLALRKNRDALAGIVIAVIVLVKINLVPLGVIFLVLRKWKAALWAAGVYVLAMASTAAAAGDARIGFHYLQRAAGTGFRTDYGFNPLDPSLANTVRSLLAPASPNTFSFLAAAAVIGATLVLLVLTISASCRNPGGDKLNLLFGLWLTTALAVNPVLEVIYMLFLFIPLVVLAREVLPAAAVADQALFGVCFVVIAAGFSFSRFPQFQSGIGVLIGNVKWFAVLGLWWLQWKALRLPAVVDAR